MVKTGIVTLLECYDPAPIQDVKKLEALGLHLFHLESAQREIQEFKKEEVKKLILEALTAWEQRSNFVEGLKNDYDSIFLGEI